MSHTRTTYQVSAGCCYCSECLFACPVNAITMDSNGAHIDEAICLGCGRCAANCASEAIVMNTRKEEDNV